MSNERFEKFLEKLAAHEVKKSEPLLQDSGKVILVHAGIRLNWLGDFLANPDIKWEERDLAIKEIQFTGTSPRWNSILIEQCGRSVEKFLALIATDAEIKSEFEQAASFGDELILARESEQTGYYKVLDGMHRFVGAVLQGKKSIKVWLPINEKKCLPVCDHMLFMISLELL